MIRTKWNLIQSKGYNFRLCIQNQYASALNFDFIPILIVIYALVISNGKLIACQRACVFHCWCNLQDVRCHLCIELYKRILPFFDLMFLMINLLHSNLDEYKCALRTPKFRETNSCFRSDLFITNMNIKFTSKELLKLFFCLLFTGLSSYAWGVLTASIKGLDVVINYRLARNILNTCS